MKLRARLVVATIAVTVPMVLALVWQDGVARHRAAAERLADATQHVLARPEERARCEADPARWGAGPPRPREHARPGPPGAPPFHGGPPHPAGVEPPMFTAYDDALRAARAGAPALSAARARGLAPGEAAMVPTAWYGDDVEVIVRTPWGDGPCAYVHAHGTTVPGWIGALLPASPIWLLPLAGVLAAVLFAVGPVIRRIRRLADAVRASAGSGFTRPIPVEGRDEVAELARAFDAAGREVQTQLAAKDQRERALREFLANTTHDVMIPLTVLQAHLTTLREGAAAGAPVDRGVVTAAMDEAHYLGALVHNLGIAAKLDAGAPQLVRGDVDLAALVTRAVGRHRPIARERGVALDHAVPEAPVIVAGDVTLLEQAVSNVVYNAIRHNRAGGHVAVVLEASADRFTLRVLDDGPGIAADELERLVERGFRSDAARRRAPDGQGLGLHITWRVAELHGLRLRFTPAEPTGLQVELDGPAGPARSKVAT